MAAYELFAAGTTDQFIANIKAKAEAYGWVIDSFGTYNGHNRLHLHNASGSHFELWYSDSNSIYIQGCTDYSSGSIPTAQPGASYALQMYGVFWHFIVIGPHAIFIKSSSNASAYNIMQFGTIVDKIGAWTGGHCISTVQVSSTNAFEFWDGSSSYLKSQVYINGAWSTYTAGSGGSIKGVCESELYTKMPFAYSGGIMPVPMLLVQLDPTTPANLHPIGYAPDFRSFNGGDVYPSLEPVTLDGEVWLPFSRYEIGSVTAATIPNTLVLLAA